MSQPETRMVAVDGTDALAYVILRPGSNASGVVIEAAAKGISKPYAAYALRHTAQSWDPDDTVGADVGEQLKEALAELTRLRAELEQARAEGRAQVIAELRTRATGPMLLRVLDEVAEFASHPEPMHQPYCVAATQGCCSCEEPTAPACTCRAEAVHQAGCDTDQGN